MVQEERSTACQRASRRILFLFGLLFALAALAPAQGAHAAGTHACTQISSQASISYRLGQSEYQTQSNLVTTRIDEILDLSVVWNDASAIAVHPGEEDRVLSFLVSNTGNGSEAVILAALSTLGGDDFDPSPAGLYLDSDGSGLFDPDIDERYSPGENEPVLAADESRTIFVLNDIPTDLENEERGLSRLSAGDLSGSGEPGTVLQGAGDCGSDAVIGRSGGNDDDTGVYIVSTVIVSILKTLSVSDPHGGEDPVTGGVITYTLEVTATGVGTALGVVVTDAIPTHSSYLSGSLSLDALSLSDEVDADAGDMGGSAPKTVTVNLGDLPAGSAARTIAFQVIIE